MRAQTPTRIEQAEALIVQMDAVQAELEQTNDYRLGPSCVRQLEGLKSDIEALGFQVKRVPTGWALVEQEAAVEQSASQPVEHEPMLHEDEQGLYAEVPASTGKTLYRVRVCARWLKTISCSCMAGRYGRDCSHQVVIEAALRDIRPTFSEWIAGKGASPETVAGLLYETGKGLAHAA